MNRFFSKLDLRDIKIDPHNTSFPPDADDVEVDAGAAVDQETSRVGTADEPVLDVREGTESGTAERQPYAPAWATGTGGAATAPSRNGAAAFDVNETAPIEQIADPTETLAERPVQSNGEVLKVSARSRPSAVAGAIAGVVREAGRAEVQAIGAGATNQAVKAVAIARDYLRETGIEAVCLPAFIDVTIENEDRTAIRLVVEPR